MQFLPNPYLFWPLLIIGLADLVIGAVIVLRKRSVLHYVVSLLCFSLGFFSFFIGIMSAGLSRELMVFGFQGAAFAGAPIPFLLLMLSEYFPDKKPQISRGRVVLLLIPFSFFAIFSFTSVWLRAESVINGGIAIRIVPFFVTTYLLYYLLFLFWAAIKFYESARTSAGISRIQINYLLLGFYLTVVIGMFCNVFMTFIGIGSFVYYGPMASIFLVGFTAYAITKTRLMDISVVISRTAAEILTILFFSAIYIGLVWLYKTYISAGIGLIFIGWTVLFGIMVGQSYQFIRLKIQTTSDKLFLRGKYDYYKELSDLTTQITKKLSLQNILDNLRRAFREVLEVSNPRIYLPEDFDKPEVKELLGIKELVFKKDEVIIPCLVEDRLIALIVLGKKLSEDPYTEEDIRLLKALAGQAAVALDHTRTYEQIKNDYEANQQKLYHAERQLELSRRLASLGTLAAGVAHEIRNPLGIIHATAEELPDKPRNAAELAELRDSIKKNTKRISSIITNMLGLAKTGEKVKLNVDLNEIIEATLQLIPISGIKLVKKLQPIPAVKAEPEGLKQVLINLIDNAGHAMPDGGVLTISTFKDTEKICLTVADTGRGIAPENLSKVFDPFFSTRHEGAGLGLSIVYRILKEQGAEIALNSELGKGTTFRISFPLIAG